MPIIGKVLDEFKVQDNIYDLIILGGGCAGLTSGIYAGRAMLDTLILENSTVGGQAAITSEIANYPGTPNISGPELMSKMLEQAKSFNVKLETCQVKSAQLADELKTIYTSCGIFRSHAVIIATGATPKKLGFEGEEEFTGRGVGYCATCDGFFFRDKDIFVIGGGNSAAEEALFLTRFGKKITILVRKGEFRCAPYLVDRVMSHPKIEVRFHTELVRAFGDSALKGAVLKNNQTGETYTYEVSQEDGNFGIFVFVGYEPTSEMFKDQLELDDAGYILTNENMETKLAGVFAAGDVRPKSLHQLVTATADGAIAASFAEKYVILKEEALNAQPTTEAKAQK